MFGLVILNKPVGMSSRQAVDCVKRLVRPAKTGHAGTLDPLASGVLVVGVGSATRLIDRVQALGKRYTGTFMLGRHSPTDDLEGDVVELTNPPRPALPQIEQAAAAFVGEILQRPPAFSALKIEGRRAYKLARQGRPVDLPPRPVTVHSLGVVRYEYPKLVLEITCGSGTYVRSLGRDLGHALGSAAVMSALVRTAIGPFDLTSAICPTELTAENLAAHLQPALRAVESLPRVTLSAAECQRVAAGLNVAAECAADGVEIAAVDSSGELVALLTPREPGQLGPTMNFRAQDNYRPSE